MKRNERGFTLVELLAVIVILGLLMAIAIPSVTKYITESRKKTLTTTVGNYISALVNEVNDLSYTFTGQNTIYAVPIECIALERGGTDPFGEWHQSNKSYFAYVLIQYDDINSKYIYGFTFKDSAGYGLYPTIQANIDEKGSQIKTGYTINKPVTGDLTSLTSLAKWQESGFKVDSNTTLQVLVATSEGQTGDGINTCTLCQKGDNYAQVEEDKTNGGSNDDDQLPPIGKTAEDYTWAEIKEISEEGKGDKYFDLGDTKTFTTTDGQVVIMQIVAFNADEKADGTGTVGITWLSKDIIAYRSLNNSGRSYNWNESALRSWLSSTFYGKLPVDLKNAIVTVTKSYDARVGGTQTVEDNLWIPSMREMYGTDGWVEKSGATYVSFFTDANSRIKYYNGEATRYSLRSVQRYGDYNSTVYKFVSSDGNNYSGDNGASAMGVVLGFCT